MTTRSIRLLIVDDSPTREGALRQLLKSEPRIQVVGSAQDPASAVAAVEALEPSVVTMDLEMPGGGGEEAIARIMATHPVPILVLSAHARGPGSTRAIDALDAGALDVFPWPAVWDERATTDLIRRVRAIDNAVVLHHWRRAKVRPRPAPVAGAAKVVGIAASTGGPPALATVLEKLRGIAAPVLVVQHLHSDFLDSFTNWMARAGRMPVVKATDGAVPAPGVAYLAPGGLHLRLGAGGLLSLSPRPAGLHVPSADELFLSMAAHAGTRGVGIILTGMGEDGAAGLLALRRAGGLTVAQDQATSVVWGMPGAAVKAGAVQQVLPLEAIAAAVAKRVGRAR